MKKVACFFTGGYTESGAMQEFLKRVNPNVNFKQFCPNKPKRRWTPGLPLNAQPKIENNLNGLTGPALIKYINDYIDDHLDELQEFDAILIEDDLDNRFFIEQIPGNPKTKQIYKTDEFLLHCQQVAETIRTKLKKGIEFPIIQLYASPEIEAWFWEDWAHSFGCIYGPQYAGVLTSNENQFFENRFRTYLKDYIIKQYINVIEYYGFFDGIYYKLSDEFITALEGKFKESMNNINNPLAKSIAGNKNLRYSKSTHGDLMLRNLSPEILKIHCPIFFAPAITQLENL